LKIKTTPKQVVLALSHKEAENLSSILYYARQLMDIGEKQKYEGRRMLTRIGGAVVRAVRDKEYQRE